MTIKTVMKGNKFVCETAHVSGCSHQGGKKRDLISQYHNVTVNFHPFQAGIIEDLLRSYINTYDRQRLPRAAPASPEVYYDKSF